MSEDSSDREARKRSFLRMAKLARSAFVKRLGPRRRAAAAAKRAWVRARKKNWRKENPVLARQYRRTRAARERRGPGITPAEWAEIKRRFAGRCAYCGCTARLTKDHVLPLAEGGAHAAANIVPACRPCNSRKGAVLPNPPYGHAALDRRVARAARRFAAAARELERAVMRTGRIRVKDRVRSRHALARLDNVIPGMRFTHRCAEKKYKIPESIQTLIVPDQDGRWIVEFPQLPGLHTFGASLKGARRLAREAFRAWVRQHKKLGIPVRVRGR